ncbi:hypothetical protein HEK616_82380 (plasmid) [Streptomyces nigrescens]|uniref:Transposase n=1 Tax=Streptomyces nigrescens TaxID=1920 RepID=A0ABM8A7M4_STRNI|nr:hypothetical protein HEK616_82380 [Streptomyces nigrescens]
MRRNSPDPTDPQGHRDDTLIALSVVSGKIQCRQASDRGAERKGRDSRQHRAHERVHELGVVMN